MIDLITGHQGFNHITAEQVAEINNAMTSGYGVDCVLRLKDGLVTSAGLAVGVGVGYWRVNGFDMQMTTAETIYVDPSSVGTSRIDGFYVEILQDIASGNQRSEFVYVKGTEASVPVAPPDPTAPVLTTDIMLQCVKFAEALIAENTLTLTDLTKGMEQVTPEDMELVKSWIRDNSDVYSSIVSHKKGEVVLNALDGKIYQCINNCGAFDWETNKSNYTEKTIVEILSDIALGGASGLKYGTCTTAASTTAKTAATANGDFELALGKSVCIRMTYANTASSPTLNVDGTGAKYIKGYGSELPSYWWLAGDMVQFVYDGTYYIMLPTQGEITSLNNDLYPQYKCEGAYVDSIANYSYVPIPYVPEGITSAKIIAYCKLGEPMVDLRGTPWALDVHQSYGITYVYYTQTTNHHFPSTGEYVLFIEFSY